MEKQALHNYQLKLLRSIQKQVKAYEKDLEPERLHQIRLEVKKIRAICSLKSFARKKKQTATKLKPVYQAAGEIREIQLLLKLVRSLPDFPKKISTKLIHSRQEAEGDFLKAIPDFTKQIKKFHKTLSEEHFELKLKTIVKYFKQEAEKSRTVFLMKQREEMHAYRKQLKNMLYVYNALPEKTKKQIPLKASQIATLQEKLGDWHDTYSAIYFLSKLKFEAKINEHILKLKRLEKAQFSSLQKSLPPILFTG